MKTPGKGMREVSVQHEDETIKGVNKILMDFASGLEREE